MRRKSGLGLSALLYLGLTLMAASTDILAEPQSQLTKDEQALQDLQDHCANYRAVEAGTGLAEFEGQSIALILIERGNVFDLNDPKENNGFYRLMNRLHIQTRANVVRSQLLFKQGQTLSQSEVEETERLLRSKSYLADAEIRVAGQCDNGVVLKVRTRDVWTTEPEVVFGHQAGQTKAGFFLTESNVLGSGNSVSVGYKKDHQRESALYNFYSPHLFNSRLAAQLGYEDSNQGNLVSFSLISPFYSLKTPYAGGVSYFDGEFDEVIRWQERDINEYRHEEKHVEGFWGFAHEVSAQSTARVSLGFSQEQHLFNALPTTRDGQLPQDYKINYPWLQYQYVENRYAVYKNLYLMHLKEDVSVGMNFRARLGYGSSAFGNDHEFIRFESRFSDLLCLGEHHLFKLSMSSEARIYQQEDELNEANWHSQLEYHVLYGDKHRWYSSLAFDRGYNLLQHNELRTGSLDGLRGYPDAYQRGEKRYLFTLEKRYVSDVHLFNLVRLGTVLFFDAGRTWGGDYQDQSDLYNVGVGLRLASSKARVGNVVHLDWAYPIADRESVPSHQWVIKASHQF